MERCKVSGAEIVTNPLWVFHNPTKHYSTRIKRIGEDILFAWVDSQEPVTLEFFEEDLVRKVIEDSDLVNKPVYLIWNLEHVKDLSYGYKQGSVDFLYKSHSPLNLVVFYNIQPEFLNTAESIQAIVPGCTRVLFADTYSDAFELISGVKAGDVTQEEYEDEEEELYAQRKKEFLAATARIGWMNMLDQPINIPEDDELLYPFFKALEALQKDLQDKDKITASERKLAESKAEKKISEKIILLNAQLELNNKLKSQFHRERAALKSRIAAQDMELTRISTAVAEKTAALQSLREKIFGIDIDGDLKKEMLDACSKMIETETIEKKINTDLTETDSEFLSKLQRRHPNLNQRDLRICLLIKLNYDTREIARSIGISTRGLESIRYRMHKKMGLSKHQSIKNYLTRLAMT